MMNSLLNESGVDRMTQGCILLSFALIRVWSPIDLFGRVEWIAHKC